MNYNIGYGERPKRYFISGNTRAMKLYLLLAALIIAFFAIIQFSKQSNSIPTPTISQKTDSQTQKEEGIKVLATNLEVPWALAYLPNGDLLITERKGTVKLLKTDGSTSEVAKISEVKQIVEGGLHGIAVDPDFDLNQYVYLYYTYGENLGNTKNEQVLSSVNTQNKVVRSKFNGQTLTDETTIVDNIPGAPIHDGGRLKFGPDKKLYITTGDAANPSLSQDKNSLAGKILRVGDGKVEIFSLGHRNPQGITWDNSGNIWSVEHGQTATDEINFVEKDKNYGWPTIRGEQKQAGLESPILQSGADTWAPGGATFFEESIYFGGLRGQALYQYDTDKKELKTHFKGQYGRIRDVILGPNRTLIFTTSNRDGRGNPMGDDDKIISVPLKILR